MRCYVPFFLACVAGSMPAHSSPQTANFVESQQNSQPTDNNPQREKKTAEDPNNQTKATSTTAKQLNALPPLPQIPVAALLAMVETIKAPPVLLVTAQSSIIFGLGQNAGLPIKSPGHTRDLVAQLQSVMPDAPQPAPMDDMDGEPAPFQYADPDNLDFLWPVGTRTISSAWGPRIRTTTVVIKSPNGNRRVRRPYTSDHKGIDLTAPKGHSIFAAMDGRVSSIGRNSKLGNYVKIDHGNGVETIYGHNSVNLVATNDIVRRGQIIARVGSTGSSTGPHLHFEVRINDQPVNPAPWLNDTEEISAEILAHNEKFLLAAPRR